ncbi:polypeptide N-acetylgalactosaminyltransferase 8 [Drosophila busckii]|uniref:polypeptide N-acetylgalactosaminyltransferase 8 n=1 Tax=Drosophila busckii TaxID=30019 RepID=UPI00083F3267|nr:polypeptide N-acetylgalactosaminyltransferase 8 [Drosophila busckii]
MHTYVSVICNVVIYAFITDKKQSEQAAAITNKTTVKHEQLFEALVLPDLGALGRPAKSANLTVEELAAVAESERQTGYNAWLSERISPERTLHDMRHRSCKKLKYALAELPAISVVIAQHNEEPSVLLRTLSSLRDRTPTALLREILLVDDGSVKIADNFTAYLRFKYGKLLQLLRLPKQRGLMQARMAGARKAQAEVLVFLDAHVEVTQGWLEPLLAPMLERNGSCTTPIVDTIDHKTFAYKRGKPSRGFFNWEFNYVQLPLLPAEQQALPAPHDNPIMNGGLFAIEREWFFKLGGYDEGLRLWGAEQFELSLKIWLCGGRLLEVPCSRVGHLYRDDSYQVAYTKSSSSASQAVSRNYRRVAEVWLDEYKDKLYANVPHLTQIKVGSLKQQKALRQRLRCKPFKWFLDNLASDFLALYPLQDPEDYAIGALQSLAAPKLCLDRAGSKTQPKLAACDEDLLYPRLEQAWYLSHFRDLHSSYLCLELQQRQPNAAVLLWQCHHQAGNQFWFYDQQSKQLINGQRKSDQRCLEAQVEQRSLVANLCNATNVRQHWKFGYVNEKRLEDFWKNIELL